MTDEVLIQKIYQHLHPELDDFGAIQEEAFDLIDEFVEKYFEIDFAELLINSLPDQNDFRKTGRILDILEWSTPDNGEKLFKITAKWLESGNKSKIKSILFREDWLPSYGIWTYIKSDLEKKIPELDELIQYYDREIVYWQVTGKRNIKELRRILKNNN